jgi:hypothetical protein
MPDAVILLTEEDLASVRTWFGICSKGRFSLLQFRMARISGKERANCAEAGAIGVAIWERSLTPK